MWRWLNGNKLDSSWFKVRYSVPPVGKKVQGQSWTKQKLNFNLTIMKSGNLKAAYIQLTQDLQQLIRIKRKLIGSTDVELAELLWCDWPQRALLNKRLMEAVQRWMTWKCVYPAAPRQTTEASLPCSTVCYSWYEEWFPTVKLNCCIKKLYNLLSRLNILLWWEY